MPTSSRHRGLSTHGRLTSVWERNDASLLEHMLVLYPRTPPKVIVDVTWGKGRMWRGVNVQPLGLDLDPGRAKDAIADYCFLPLKDNSVDVLVFDPPHLVKTGSPGVIKGLYSEYLRESDPLLPFMLEAKRVLVDEGVIFVKVCDFVTSARYHWRIVDTVLAIRQAGMCPCDLIIKTRPSGVIEHPFWKSQRHARKRHSYWLVVRNSTKCS
jgi:hypothetical protein